jgi:hypothetical protein
MQELLASQAAYFCQWYAYYELLPQQTGCVLDWPEGEVGAGGFGLLQELQEGAVVVQAAACLLCRHNPLCPLAAVAT